MKRRCNREEVSAYEFGPLVNDGVIDKNASLLMRDMREGVVVRIEIEAKAKAKAEAEDAATKARRNSFLTYRDPTGVSKWWL